MMKNDDFGDRMKCYERELRSFVEFKDDDETDTLYLYARLDGRSFSKFTKKMASSNMLVKPRDYAFENVFVEAVKDTVKEFNLTLGFHQSDEISLFFQPLVKGGVSQLPFNGNLTKLNSVLASYFTARWIYHFNEAYKYVPEVSFDCRFVVFKEKFEAVNMLVWRWQDATRNVIQDYAHHLFGHSKLMNMSTRDKLELVKNSVPDFEENILKTFGNFVKRENYEIDTTGEYENDSAIRSRYVNLDVDFRNMPFEERMELVYSSQ